MRSLAAAKIAAKAKALLSVSDGYIARLVAATRCGSFRVALVGRCVKAGGGVRSEVT